MALFGPLDAVADNSTVDAERVVAPSTVGACTNDPKELLYLLACCTFVNCVYVPTFMLFAQEPVPRPGQWWQMSVDPYDANKRSEDEEYFAEILAVHNGTVDTQDLEEASGPEYKRPFDRSS